MEGCVQRCAALRPARLRGCAGRGTRAEARSHARAKLLRPRCCAAQEPPAPPPALRRRAALAGALAAATAVAGGACRAETSAAASPPCAAPDASGAASYDAYAQSYDTLNDGALADAFGLPALRAELLARARGDVLEIGAGTGLNLPLYRFAEGAVRSLTAVDLSGAMLGVARARAATLGLCVAGGTTSPPVVRFVVADATALPFAAASYDTVLDTFSLCVLGEAAPAALAEMARVLRPSGRVLLLEHSRSAFEPLGAYQDATAAAVAASGKGCFWNQRVAAMLPAAGLRLVAQRDALGGTLAALEAERISA